MAPALAGRVVAVGIGGIPRQQLGAITGNDPVLMARWARWLGRPQDHNLLAFNQDSWEKLEASIPYVTGVGRKVVALKGRVMWSVPVGGWGGYESLVAGQRDGIYNAIAGQILAAQGAGGGRICIRPPWEFNIPMQSQAAKSARGAWDSHLYVSGYRRIVAIFKRASPRFYFDWCANVGPGDVDTAACYPGDDMVDVVSLDLYYRGQYDNQGKTDAGASIFQFRKTQPYGLDWLDGFAAAHHKLIGISEWGVDDNSATAFTAAMADWLKRLGPRLSHHNYWDRVDGGINSRISDGSLPAIGREYRRAFGARVA